MLKEITTARLLLEVDLQPVQGQRFQPTGFANLGAALYTLPDDTPMLLVESVQSMANRLENTVLTPEGELIPELQGLSYVRATLQPANPNAAAEVAAVLPENTRLSTLTEAHRLASPFIISELQARFCEEAGYSAKGRLNWQRINAALFRYDVNSLLHGVFLSTVEGGRIKAPRLISAFIEARGVRAADSGGVKNTFDPKGEVRHEKYDKDVYSNVPYSRTEYVAEGITLYCNLDLAGIRGLGLPEEAQELLLLLGLYKLRRLLDSSLRLRTACDLKLKGEPRLEGLDCLPTQDELLKDLQAAIAACTNRNLFADPPVTELISQVKVKKKTENATDETDNNTEETGEDE